MIRRTPFGIEELDRILSGGIPSGSIVLLAGSPGAGKTVLAAQFLINGCLTYGEKGVFVSFADSPKVLREYMHTLGWNLERLESEGKLLVLDPIPVLKEGIEDSIDLILQKVTTFKPARLALDSLPSLTLAFDSKVELRGVLSILNRRLKEIGTTSILVTEIPWGSRSLGSSSEEFLSDGIIVLETVQQKAQYIRRLSVLKMRFTSHETRFYRYAVETGKGLVLAPVAQTAMENAEEGR